MNRRRNRPYYHTCPVCGANLDPGERCDCEVPRLCSITKQVVTYRPCKRPPRTAAFPLHSRNRKAVNSRSP